MRLYGITESEVESIIDVPDDAQPTKKGRINAIKRTQAGIIRVTYAEEAYRIVIVTVSPRRRI